jgi:hypothetical protein
MTWAEQQLRDILFVEGLAVKGSYHPGEVRTILGISDNTYYSLIKKFERRPDGTHLHPDSLDSYMTHGQYRVLYTELVRYLRDNSTNERLYGFPGAAASKPNILRPANRPDLVRPKNNPRPGPRQPGLFDSLPAKKS